MMEIPTHHLQYLFDKIRKNLYCLLLLALCKNSCAHITTLCIIGLLLLYDLCALCFTVYTSYQLNPLVLESLLIYKEPLLLREVILSIPIPISISLFQCFFSKFSIEFKVDTCDLDLEFECTTQLWIL